jgi:hypothetical protein
VGPPSLGVEADLAVPPVLWLALAQGASHVAAVVGEALGDVKGPAAAAPVAAPAPAPGGGRGTWGPLRGCGCGSGRGNRDGCGGHCECLSGPVSMMMMMIYRDGTG